MGGAPQGQILRYDGSTGAFLNTFVAQGSGGLSSPDNPIFRGADLYVSSDGQGVLRYNATTGAFLGTFVAPGSGGLGTAASIAFSPYDGNLYVSDLTGNDILRYNGSTGAFIGAFVAPGSGGLDRPDGLALGSDGNLYVSSQGTQQLLEYNGATGAYIGVAFDLSGTNLSPSFVYSTGTVPEPGSLTLLSAGLIAMIAVDRRLGRRPRRSAPTDGAAAS